MSTVDMTTPLQAGSFQPTGLPHTSAPRSRRGRRFVLSADPEARCAGRISSPGTFPAPYASTSTRLPTIPIRCRTCCRARAVRARVRRARHRAIATRSWCMTASGYSRPRGCGGRSACSAQRRCSSSTAACRNGNAKAARSRAGSVARRRACSAPASRPGGA